MSYSTLKYTKGSFRGQEMDGEELATLVLELQLGSPRLASKLI